MNYQLRQERGTPLRALHPWQGRTRGHVIDCLGDGVGRGGLFQVHPVTEIVRRSDSIRRTARVWSIRRGGAETRPTA